MTLKSYRDYLVESKHEETDGGKAFAAGLPRIPPFSLDNAGKKKWLRDWDLANIASPITEEFLEEATVEQLRAAYANISSIDPASDSYKKLVGYLDKLPVEQLKTLAGAKVKFISALANNRINKLTQSGPFGADSSANIKLQRESVDKEYQYEIHRKGGSGSSEWEHHKGDTYNSLEDAKRVVGNMKRGATVGTQHKIVRVQREKLSGPSGRLPESEEELAESTYFLSRFLKDGVSFYLWGKGVGGYTYELTHAQNKQGQFPKVGTYDGNFEDVERKLAGLGYKKVTM